MAAKFRTGFSFNLEETSLVSASSGDQGTSLYLHERGKRVGAVWGGLGDGRAVRWREDVGEDRMENEGKGGVGWEKEWLIVVAGGGR
jgi:hypothetical protein